jgi:hypothetical protein
MCCSRASLACSDCTRASGGLLKPFVFLFRRGSYSSVQLLDRLRERERGCIVFPRQSSFFFTAHSSPPPMVDAEWGGRAVPHLCQGNQDSLVGVHSVVGPSSRGRFNGLLPNSKTT